MYYSASASLVKDRLELKGYTLDTAKRAFIKRMRVEAKEYANLQDGAPAEIYDRFETIAKRLKSLNVDEWLAALRSIKEQGLKSHTQAITHDRSEVDLESYMLDHDWYGFSGGGSECSAAVGP